MKQLNKVTKKECMDAINYFCTLGIRGETMGSDDALYTEIQIGRAHV